MKILKTIALGIVLFTFITGCAVTPEMRFSEFYERPSHPGSVDVVIDTVVLSDIAGSDVGFNAEKNRVAVESVSEGVPNLFASRRFEPNVVFEGNGAFFERGEDTEYFYCEDFRSTGEIYLPPVLAPEHAQWADPEVQAFMRRLLERARVANLKKSSRKVPPITNEEIPAYIQSLPSNYLALVTVGGGEIGAGKSFATGLLTGVLTAALTGGTYAYVGTSVSGTRVDIVLFDKATSSVVWHNGGQGGRYTKVRQGLETLMESFPMQDSGSPSAVDDALAGNALQP